MDKETALSELEAQGRLEPGQEGWWKVWGAQPRHIRRGDIVISKTEDTGRIETYFIEDVYRARAHPMRVGIVVDGKKYTIGAMSRLLVYRKADHNLLAE